MKKRIGHVVSGSLHEGFTIKLDPEVSLENIKTGKFVSILGTYYTFFSLITDLALHVTSHDIVLFPPQEDEHLLQKFLKKRDMYATVQVKPMLMLERKSGHKMPVKTIPVHFSAVAEASNEDVARIFGDENDSSGRYFTIGTPLDMTTPVCIDLERLTERSNGIFGKTGTGKTFITRLVLAGLIKRDKAVNLIFDMHSEYGLQARKEGEGIAFVKGLKTIFQDKVAIFSLDPASTRRRGGNPDVVITLSLQDINVEDITCLQEELNLHATAVEAAYLIYARYKKDWLSVLLQQAENLKEFAQELGAHPESVAALYRKLKRIERFPFIQDNRAISNRSSVIDDMMSYIQRGISIIIEFGNYSSAFCYLLIANIITRRIHSEYVQRTEKFLGSHNPADEPKKLMITIEEAHKFLNPQAARQTIFGIIAREMRKYYVSLLVVDQRPSGIDQEIISQIGTKIVAQLNDEKDIAGVLTGVNNATQLRAILASLDSKKQALAFGHAVAMPVVIQTREYDEQFYRAMAPDVTAQDVDVLIKELF